MAYLYYINISKLWTPCIIDNTRLLFVFLLLREREVMTHSDMKQKYLFHWYDKMLWRSLIVLGIKIAVREFVKPSFLYMFNVLVLLLFSVISSRNLMFLFPVLLINSIVNWYQNRFSSDYFLLCSIYEMGLMIWYNFLPHIKLTMKRRSIAE